MYERQGRAEEALLGRRELLAYHRVDRALTEGDANTLNIAAWELLTAESQEFRDPAAALPLALRANQMTDHQDPNYLDTLALAQQMNGDIDAAIETQTKAVDLLAPGPSAMRGEIESNLLKYLLEEQRFAEAELMFLAMAEQLVENSDVSLLQTKTSIERLAEFYESWHAAKPGQGYDAKAAEWRAKLPDTDPDSPSP